MDRIARVFSRPVAKPYRNGDIRHEEVPYLNDDGHVDFTPDDVENPKNWSRGRRSYVTFAAVLLVLNATFASSSPSGCFPSISESFGISTEVAGLTITLFLLGYVAGPLIFAPLSEFYGRRYIFLATFLLYLAFNFLCAFAPNYGSLLVGRFLTGTFVSAPLSNSPGVLADLWNPVERGVAMAAFSCMVWVGPAVGPITSGFLNLKEDWRWSFYVLLWLGAGTLPFLFTIPETYAPVILRHKARRIRKARIAGYEEVKAPIEDSGMSLFAIYKVALIRPWIILFDPISFLCAIYIAVVYMLLYMLFTIYPIVFQEKRGWNSGVGELPLLGTVVGAVLGSTVVFIKSRGEAKRMARGEQIKPEDRLVLAMFGGIGFAIGNFWLAWTGNFDSVHWVAVALAGVCLAMSMVWIFVAFLNYLVDTYLMYAASAIAANTVVRSAAGAAAPLFTNQMFTRLGVGGGGSLIGGVATVLAIIPFAFYRYGERIRVRSKFAPTDKKKKPADDEERQEQQHRQGQQHQQHQQDGRSGPATAEHEEEETAARHSSSSTITGDATEPDEQPPRAYDSAHRHLASEDGREKDRDVHQNEMGEPRTENAMFGKEGR